ncbi:hypothetical protein Tsubulata_005400, partial [Turnera subulata]
AVARRRHQVEEKSGAVNRGKSSCWKLKIKEKKIFFCFYSQLVRLFLQSIGLIVSPPASSLQYNLRFVTAADRRVAPSLHTSDLPK